ncbi:Riboflavin kinase, partial [Parasponia andersonii]
WCNIKALPGANSASGVGLKLFEESIEAKISFGLSGKLSKISKRESFSVIIGGDEVRARKPSPKIFLEAAKRLNVEPSGCLVIEDSVYTRCDAW